VRRQRQVLRYLDFSSVEGSLVLGANVNAVFFFARVATGESSGASESYHCSKVFPFVNKPFSEFVERIDFSREFAGAR